MRIDTDSELYKALGRIKKLRKAAVDSPEAAQLIREVNAVQDYHARTGRVRDTMAEAEDLEMMCVLADRMIAAASDFHQSAAALFPTLMSGNRRTLIGLLNKAVHVSRGVVILCRAHLHLEALSLMRSLLDAVANLKLLTRGDAQAMDEAARRYHHACNREQAKVYDANTKIPDRAAIMRKQGTPHDHVAKVLAAQDMGAQLQEELWEARHWAHDSAEASDEEVYERIGMKRAYAFEYRVASISIHAKDYERYAPPAPGAKTKPTIDEGTIAVAFVVMHLKDALEVVAPFVGVPAPQGLDAIIDDAMKVRAARRQSAGQ